MKLLTSSTGSYPPLFDPELGASVDSDEERESQIAASIERAIRDQIELGIDVLVDGQPRDDIVSMFLRHLPGCQGSALPFDIVDRVRPSNEPITTKDFQFAKRLAGSHPLKAHITGPITLARNARIGPQSPYQSRNDPMLVKDCAIALGVEARNLVEAGANIIQIDEPLLVDDFERSLAVEALKVVVDTGEIPTVVLHVCGNVTQILRDIVIHAPIDVISMEAQWLTQPALRWISKESLLQHKKKIGLGCIRTNSQSTESIPQIRYFVDSMVVRLGPENIWAVMPNCGMRVLPYPIAYRKLAAMVEATRSVSLLLS